MNCTLGDFEVILQQDNKQSFKKCTGKLSVGKNMLEDSHKNNTKM